jgi:hypothetical protein
MTPIAKKIPVKKITTDRYMLHTKALAANGISPRWDVMPVAIKAFKPKSTSDATSGITNLMVYLNSEIVFGNLNIEEFTPHLNY